MKTKLVILFLLASFVTDLASQERTTSAVSFGERVIRDYLSCYDTMQKTHPQDYPDTHFWFEDSDTRQMAASFLNTYADSLTTDTVFFINQKGALGEVFLNVALGDTLFWLQIHWSDGDYRSFEAYKTPFLNAFSKIYWEDLREWDTAHISKPSEVVTCGGVHSYIVRLIYRNGLLVSTKFCHHAPKAEYDAEWYRPELDIKIPYPENKQWPQIKL